MIFLYNCKKLFFVVAYTREIWMGMKVLITGGAGSLGSAIVKALLRNPIIKAIIVFSRNETQQFNLKEDINYNEKVSFVTGDVSDYNSVYNAMIDVDVVFHTAALKHIEVAEQNPMETIKTNVLGTMNVVNVCNQRNVKKMIFVSTDKACNPTSIYGTSKLLAEKNVLLSNSLGQTEFSVVRFGNIVGSNGSIFKKWQGASKISLTSKEMTRLFISAEDAAEFSISLIDQIGGRLFVPKMKSAKIYDIAKAIVPDEKITVVGLRPGEKLHEDIISATDTGVLEINDKYISIIPGTQSHNFIYNSSTNSQWFSGDEIREFFK